MAEAARLKRLGFTRKSLISNLKHAIAGARELSKVSKPLLIVCKDRTLERYWLEFQANLTEIINLSDEMENEEAFFIENQALEDEFHSVKVYLENILPTSDDVDRSINFSFFNASGNNDNGGTGGPSGDSQHKSHRSHLPDIKLQAFDGNYDNWNQFSQMFSKLISKEKLDAVDKLYYLKQSLVGEPLQLIKHLPVTNDGFENAWKLLTRTYEVRRHIVNAQFNLFFSIKKMKTENATELKNMLRICLECESAFNALEIEAHGIGLMMVYYCSLQMATETSRQWETELKNHSEEPKLEELIEFLQTRCRLLNQFEKNEMSNRPSTSKGESSSMSQSKPFRSSKTFLSQSNKEPERKCLLCEPGATHRIYTCPMFVNATVDERMKMVIDKKLCFNCLFPHRVEECKSKYSCSKCKKRHNTLLHFERPNSTAATNNNNSNGNFTGHLQEGSETLLATACVPIFHENGEQTIVRALIDQGSTSNFVSEKVCQLASYFRKPMSTTITSLNGTRTGKIKSFVHVTVGSLYDRRYQYTFDALVMQNITNVSAINTTHNREWNHIAGLQLADPKYFETGDIDLLIGARAYSEIILDGLRKGHANAPIAQATKFGWILSGACENQQTYTRIQCNLAIVEENTLSRDLQRFWELEEVSPRVMISNEDEICEKKFVEGVSRASDGKIITRLPFKVDPTSENFLGNSYNQAFSRLISLERRLSKDDKLYESYRQVLNEYLELNHMREATPEEIADSNAYFMPHHAVVKMTKTTSKVRVVFDASCKSSNGKSLNDQLMVGATIQDDLFSLILRWRKYKIAYTGDIEKMYRQFWLHADDVKYHRILWRNESDEDVKQYILLTVTFGTASAPFQAIRSLHHIADEVEAEKPDLARAIKEKFYVDDFLSCSDTVQEALDERQDLSHTLSEYGLNITKWKSNSKEFQSQIPDNQQENVLEFADASCKALGILWKPQEDMFTFKLNLEELKAPLTKRKIVSEVAKLFDPLGWLAPSIVLAKLVIQQLWLESYDWDDLLPNELQEYWVNLRKLLFQCDKIKIDRWVGLTKHTESCSIHGFSDASERAYAAVAYLRTENIDGSIQIHLLAAKSKVAPLQKVSLPRLELCGALLLSRLIKKVVTAMNLTNTPIHAYSDSTIVLSWLQEHPIRWQTFVANRVAEIQESLPATKWRHVISQLNPADCASRGIFIDELRTFDLWWHGPEFLKLSEDHWPTKPFKKLSNEQIPEQRKSVKVFHAQVSEKNYLLHRFSTLTKVLKTTAYALRWRNYRRTTSFDPANGVLSVKELDDALRWWVRLVQADSFADEVHRIKKNKELKSSSPIISLTPYDDGQQILRVRGRLTNSNLPMNTKHQMILPSHHRFTWLIINEAHMRTEHGGCQLTLQYIRQRFWIVQGRRTVGKQVNKCLRCFRYKKKAQLQLMGDLPKSRFQVTYPFQFTGVDFAGYFEVKQSSRKNAPYEKCYVCLFVCMVTKAIHLELAKDLSTEAFIDCYRCFIARRGIPERMYSDRGTNFIGASTEMPNRLYNARERQTQLVINECLNNRTEWRFNPAHSPHFGGLWEAGVKSMKHHLKRVVHQAKLTEHRFRVVLTQIEACLNSRPLCKLTEDSEDLEVLTPGHLLMGRAPNTLPEPDCTNIPNNRLNVYQQSQRIVQDFWKQWHLDYLQSLQQRSKWTAKQNNISVGQVVLLKEDNLPPSRWLLGKIISVTYGADQLVRVVEVRCKNSVLSRSIHKLCLLPTEDNELEDISHALNAGENVGAANQ